MNGHEGSEHVDAKQNIETCIEVVIKFKPEEKMKLNESKITFKTKISKSKGEQKTTHHADGPNVTKKTNIPQTTNICKISTLSNLLFVLFFLYIYRDIRWNDRFFGITGNNTQRLMNIICSVLSWVLFSLYVLTTRVKNQVLICRINAKLSFGIS